MNQVKGLLNVVCFKFKLWSTCVHYKELNIIRIPLIPNMIVVLFGDGL